MTCCYWSSTGPDILMYLKPAPLSPRPLHSDLFSILLKVWQCIWRIIFEIYEIIQGLVPNVSVQPCLSRTHASVPEHGWHGNHHIHSILINKMKQMLSHTISPSKTQQMKVYIPYKFIATSMNSWQEIPTQKHKLSRPVPCTTSNI